MLTFDCPSCQTKLQAAAEQAGETTKCPTCRRMATVPQSIPAARPSMPLQGLPMYPAAPAWRHARSEDEAFDDDEQPRKPKKASDEDDEEDDDRPRKRQGSSGAATAAGMGIGMILVIVFGALGCCVCAPISIALLVPAVQKVREAAARTQSINNLKQIGLSFQSFHDANKRLPFNGTGPAIGGNPTSGSWGFQILPFMNQDPMFQNPQAGRNSGVVAFMCPGRSRPPIETSNGGGPWTDYFYNNYLNDPKQASKPNVPDTRRKVIDITDGTSNTIFAGHGNINMGQYASAGNVTLSTNIFTGGTNGTMRAGNDGDTAPAGVTLQRDGLVDPGIGSWGGPFPQGALMGMGDGTVRTFPYGMQNFSSFLTPTGNEPVLLPN
jgi:hypothetical protein